MHRGYAVTEAVPQRRSGPGRRLDWIKLIPWALVLVAVGVYLNSLGGAFLFDDDHAILRNLRIRRIWPFIHFFEAARPLVDLTFAINYAIDGLEPRGYHLVNMLIHVGAGLTLYGLIRRTMRLRGFEAWSPAGISCFAGAVALLFLVHPLQTQAVTYIVQRAESMASLFYLVMLYCFARSVAKGASCLWGVATVAACVLGMLSKPTVVTAPATVLIYDYVFVAASPFEVLRRRWGVYLGLLSTWSLLWVVSIDKMLTMKGASAGFHTGIFTWWQYAMTQPEVILHYLRLSFWPHPLCLDYVWLPPTETWRVVGPGITVGLLFLSSAWLAWRRSWVGFAGMAFFAILSPTSSVVPVADMAVEHRMYLPLASVIVLTAGAVVAVVGRLPGLSRAGPRARGALDLAVVVLTAVPLGAATVYRNWQYNSDIRIWQSVVAVRPTNARGHHNLGSSYSKHRMVDEAMASYETAIALVPSYADAYNNLGKVYLDMGQMDRALAHFEHAKRINPNDATFHYNVGRALIAKGALDRAERHLRDALDINPDLAVAYSNLGILELRRDRPDEAMRYFRLALSKDPDLVYALFNIGKIHLDAGRTAEAIDYLHRAATSVEDDPTVLKRVYNTYGAALAQAKRYDEAVRWIARSLDTDPEFADAHANLGAVFLEGGRPDMAARAYNEAMRLRPDDPELMRRLAWVYATSADASVRDGDRAVPLAEAAWKAGDQADVQALITIAAAYAEAGRFDDAVRAASAAEKAAGASGQDRLAREAGRHLALYETGRTLATGHDAP